MVNGFSVIMPTYNQAYFIRRAVLSLIRQSYPLWELIIVNDGSTDGSPKLIEQYALWDSRIKVISQTNQGLSVARNAGLDIATGDYVMFIDSDDYISLNVCQSASSFIQKNGTFDVLQYGRYRFNDKMQIKQEIFWEDVDQYVGIEFLEKSILSDRFYASSCHKIYRNGFLAEYNLHFIRGILHEDYSFVFQALVYAHSIGLLKECYYYYRYTPGSITNVIKKKDLDVLITVKFLEDFCDGVNPDIKEQYYFKKTIYSWVAGVICFKYPSRFPLSREANAIVKKVLHDPVFGKYVSYFAYKKDGPWVYRLSAWLALNIYPLFVLMLCLNYNMKKLFRKRIF